jgi:hypothetical protein
MASIGKNFFASNLLQLQNQIKRDPTSYKDEVIHSTSQKESSKISTHFCFKYLFKFVQTHHNYESTLQVYLMKPSRQNKQLADLALFLAHVSHCFPDELKSFPQQLIDILKRYATVLNPEIRLVHFLKPHSKLFLVKSKCNTKISSFRPCVNVSCSLEIRI